MDKITIEQALQSELQKWLRDEHEIHIYIKRESIGSDEWVFGYVLDYLPKEFQEEKRRAGYFIKFQSFKEGIGTYSGGWDSYEEALENALKHALKIIETKNTSQE